MTDEQWTELVTLARRVRGEGRTAPVLVERGHVGPPRVDDVGGGDVEVVMSPEDCGDLHRRALIAWMPPPPS